MANYIIFIFLILRVLSINYLSFYKARIDDCLNKLFITPNLIDYSSNKNKNDFTSEYPAIYSESNNCDYYDQNRYFLMYYPYEYNNYLNFEFKDTVHFDGFMCITIHFNEYIVITDRPSNEYFWKCYDCYGDNSNFKKGDNCYNYFYTNENLNNEYEYFHFTFIVDSFENIKYKEYNVNENFYSFNSPKTINYYYHINHIPDEIDLINFNTTENFCISGKKDLEIEYLNYYFKINYLSDSFYKGKFKD